MYKYRITKKIDECIERLNDLRNKLDRRGPLPRVWLGRTRRDLQSEAVAASTSMEGIPVTVDEVRRILIGEKVKSVTPENQEMVLGYRSAMEYVLRRADDAEFKWQRELVLNLHDRILGGDYSKRAGRIRKGQNWIVLQDDGSMVYLPPAADKVPTLIDEMCDWCETRTNLHPAIIAALVHVRLAGIHPFSDGNGRTARVLASLAMYRGGFKLPEFTSLEEWWGRHRQDYYSAFAALKEGWESSKDVTSFIEAHISAQTKQVEALSLREATQRMLWIILSDIVQEENLDTRATNALFDVFFNRLVTNEYYRQLSDIHVNTATNDLKRLEAASLLKASGYGRTRVYGPGANLYIAVARHAGLKELKLSDGLPLERQSELVVAKLAANIKI